MAIRRRQFLQAGLSLPLLSACDFAGLTTPNGWLVSGYRIQPDPTVKTYQHGVLAFDPKGNVRADFTVNDEVHLACFSPDLKHILVCSRIPGAALTLYDFDGKLIASALPPNHQHFEGHAVFSDDSQFIYATASNYQTTSGKLLKLKADDLSVINEFDSGGIGPHELVWQTSTTSNRTTSNRTVLAIANTGVKTHPDSGRKPLNIDDIHSNVSLFDTQQQTIIHQWFVNQDALTARHLDALPNGDLMIGCQYKKDDQYPVVIALARPEQNRLSFSDNQPGAFHFKMQGYSASVTAFGDSRALITNPRGHLISQWNTQKTTPELQQQQSLQYAKGAVADRAGKTAYISQGQGKLWRYDQSGLTEVTLKQQKTIWWGNHMSGDIG